MIDLSMLKANMGADTCIVLAKAAKKAERFHDMIQIVREMGNLALSSSRELTTEERNLIATAFKNIVGQQRAARNIVRVEESTDDLSLNYKLHIQKEMVSFCQESIKWFAVLKIQQSSVEAKLFFSKLMADFYRYIAEVHMDDNPTEFEKHHTAALDLYTYAMEVAEQKLHCAHPLRLGVGLNIAVYYYDIVKDTRQACQIAKNSFNSAISKLDSLDEIFYKESTLLMQLLRDNMTAWTIDH